MWKLRAPRKQEKYKQIPQIMNASQLVAFVSVKENIQRANNVIIVYLERLAFVSVKENIQRANNVIIVYLER